MLALLGLTHRVSVMKVNQSPPTIAVMKRNFLYKLTNLISWLHLEKFWIIRQGLSQNLVTKFLMKVSILKETILSR